MKFLLLLIPLLWVNLAYASETEISDSFDGASKEVISEAEIEHFKAETEKEYTDVYNDVDLVHVYTVDEVNAWVEVGTHLKNISVVHNCQFAPDIERRAKKSVASAYEYLYGEMLITNTCFNKDVQTGIHFLQQSASKGYPAAMLKLAYYYEVGRYVEQDTKKAEVLMHEAAMTGFVPARIEWVGMLLRGIGSTKDYMEAYGWLHNSVPASNVQFEQSASYLKQLASLMPKYLVEKAKKSNLY